MQKIGNLNTLPSGASSTTPRSCVVIPNKTTDKEGFIDTRNKVRGQPVYVSVTAVREMGRLCGLVDESDVADLAADYEKAVQEQWDALAETVAELGHVHDLEAARDLIDAEEASAK